MNLAAVVLSAALFAVTPAQPIAADTVEIFLMPVAVDDDTLKPVARSLERRLAQRLTEEGHRTMTSQDIGALFDLAAARQTAGCDDDSDCAAELAGSLGAERIVTASLSRIDDLYRLDLALTDRKAAQVLGRGRATGRTAEELERDLDVAIGALFGEAPPTPTGPSALVIGGGIGIGVGVLVATVGGVLGARAFVARDALNAAGADFDAGPSEDGVQALADAHAADEQTRQTWNTIGLPLVAGGVAIALAGGVAVALGSTLPGE